MQKVITINLNGQAYQLDEPAFDALLAYFARAEEQLHDNPDRAEIMTDLEQAIAEKCVPYLGPRKTVVTAAEIAQILQEMGPVDGGRPNDGARRESATGSAGAGRTDAHAPKRLYLIREGAMIAGVCNGIAAYFNVDPTIIRIIFVGLALLTKGFWILAYVVLAIVIPTATTSEERAAAQGVPFTAQELIDRAKRKIDAKFKRPRWRWRPRASWSRPPSPPAGYATRVFAGFMVPVLSLANAVIFWLFAYILVSLIATRQAFGDRLPDDWPLWAGILMAAVIYNAVVWPLHAARRASYYAVAGDRHGAVEAWDGAMSFGFSVVIVWLAYRYVPEVHQLIDALPAVWESFRDRTI